MRPLLVLVLVLAAISALLFAVFRIDSGPRGNELTPPVTETPAAPQKPVQLDGAANPGGDRVVTAPSKPDRSVVGGSGAVALDNRLTGLVRNPQNQPVAGCEVILTTLNATEMFFVNDPLPDLSKEPRVRTDGEGRYTFVGVAPRDRYTLVLTHPDYSRKEEGTLPVAETGVAEMPPITMVPGASLSGRVRNEAGDPVAGATLHLEGFSYQGLGIVAPDRLTVLSDAQGGFTFKNVPKGQRFMTAAAPGYAQKTIPGLNFEKEEVVMRDVTLPLAEGLCGRVIGPGNAGIEGATVIAVGVSNLQQTSRAQVLTNKNGEWCFDVLAPGDYNIIASAKGFRMVSRSNRVGTGTSNHVIEMLKEATLTGRVTEMGSGKPVTSYSTRVRVHYGAGVPTAPYNDDVFPQQSATGEFVIDGIPPGDFVVEAWAPGYAPAFSAPFTVTPGNPVSGITVQLGRGGSISGRLVDADGKPVARARVTSHDNEWTDDEFTKALGNTYPTNATAAETRTGDDGRFMLQGLTPETYQINVAAAGFTALMRKDIRVSEGVDTAVGDLRLGRGGSVRGTLFDAAGKPLVGGTVNLTIASGDVPRSYSTRTGSDGRFQISSVAPGRYKISGMRPGSGESNPFAQIADQRNSELSVVVEEGQTSTQDLHLTE